MKHLRCRIAATGFAVSIALIGGPAAAERSAPVEHLVARAAAGRIDIIVERWSPSEDGDSLRSALAGRGPDMLLGALQTFKRRAGFVLFPGVQGRGARARTRRGQNLQFAREIVTGTGRQVILVTDRRPGFDEDRGEPMPEREFTLIDIRLSSDGRGVGRLGTASGVTSNKATRTLELKDYAKRPLVLTDVMVSAGAQ